MNFIRNIVSVIPRVNLNSKKNMVFSSSMPYIQKQEKQEKQEKTEKANKTNKDKNNKNKNINELDNIDKIDIEYLTKKSIEHANYY